MYSSDKTVFVDIHTHNPLPIPETIRIYNLEPGKSPESERKTTLVSQGIHPWNAGDPDVDIQLALIGELTRRNVLAAIGEAGLDRIHGPEMEIQERVFLRQTEFAEQVKLPMIIHCVKAWDQLLKIHRSVKPEMPWILHGFQGGPEQAAQLVQVGLHLCFGPASLRKTKTQQAMKSLENKPFFLEADDSGLDVRELYRETAGILGCDLACLREKIFRSFCQIFHRSGCGK